MGRNRRGEATMKRISVLLTAVFALAAVSAFGAEGGVVGKGFAGMLKGKVTGRDGRALLVEVTGVEKAWKQSTFEKPESLVGQKISILPSKKSDMVGKFAETLKVGDEVSFDVRQDGKSMVWLELTGDQRARVGEGGKVGAGDREEPRIGDREKPRVGDREKPRVGDREKPRGERERAK